jgi:hypothetical protein
MLKATLLATALAFGLASPVRAASDIKHGISQPVQTALPAEVVEVQTNRRSPGSVIIGAAVGGAVLGAAVGGGVALYRRYGSGDETWGNWQRDVAVGAGIGLAAGLVFGVVDASGTADRTFTGPVADRRSTGFAPPAAVYGARF